MIAFIDSEFLQCVSIGIIAGGTAAGLVLGIRSVVRLAMKLIRKA